MCEEACCECIYGKFEDVAITECDSDGNPYTDYVGQWVCHRPDWINERPFWMDE